MYFLLTVATDIQLWLMLRCSNWYMPQKNFSYKNITKSNWRVKSDMYYYVLICFIMFQ